MKTLSVRLSRARGARTGFTMIEIMIVVTLLGVLAGLAVPSIVKARTSARIKQAESDLEILAAGTRQLAWDTGEWPGGIPRNSTANPELWDLSTHAAGLLRADSRFDNWQGPYVPKVPLDPWGSPYFFDPDYNVSGVNKVVVGSFGPNQTGRNHYDSDNIYIILLE